MSKKSTLPPQKGVRQNVVTKKENLQDHIQKMYANAKKMAARTQERIKGKVLVPHPSLKNTWIYVDAAEQS